MKRVLSFLLCVVLLKAQVLAMTGGPNQNSTKNIDVSGTYSGVLIPTDGDSGTDSADGTDSLNSMGLFGIGMPLAGPGTGTFLIFTSGLTFSGTIAAVGDSGKGTVNGILEGTYEFTDFVYDAAGNPILNPTTGELITQDYVIPVRGTLTAEVTPTLFTDPNAILTSNFGRITGKAEMGIIQGLTALEILRYNVDGVKQDFEASGDGGLSAAGTP